MPIIQSLLDNDLYKFTMQQIVLNKFPTAYVEYEFRCRNRVKLSNYRYKIKQEIDSLGDLSLNKYELEYLATFPFFKSAYGHFLEKFKLNTDCVLVDSHEDELIITIKGPWFQTILFEVPILAIVNEVYNRHKYPTATFTEASVKLYDKMNLISDSTYKPRFMEFGTRRRFSRDWQETVVKRLSEYLPYSFMGTSNLFLAKKYKLQAFGTMAHEYLQAAQVLAPSLLESQKFAMETWAAFYRDQLSIVLSDVITMKAFLNDFDCYFSKIFDGVRQDSGDPFDWGNKLISHYQNSGVNPLEKTAIFSDGLTIPKAINLSTYFHNRIQMAFGIGTDLTNDVFPDPLNIVIKMTKCNGQPVAKISDSPGKSICTDGKYLRHLKETFNVEEK